MPRPLKNLPLMQNWDCHTCGNCCTDYWVPVSGEERKRIESQGWENEPDFKGRKLFQKYGRWWNRRYRLNHREGERCIFLSDKGLCQIHAKFGIMAKPFACRLYPYILVPVDDHFRISLRFACPSAAGNLGRPLSESLPEIRQMAQEMEVWDRDGKPPIDSTKPPALQGRQRVGWDDVDLFLKALSALIKDQRDPMTRRMLKCLALGRLCRQSQFDKISGSRLREFLDMLRVAVNAEVPRDLAKLPPPGWIGRLLLRTSLAIYLRKDQGSRRGVSKRGKLALIGAMWKMVRGKGKMPDLQVGLPEQTMEEFETPTGDLSAEAEAALERYYTVKIESMQFCGPTNFRYSFWDGFDSLALTLPMILWAARGYRDLGQPAAIFKAITLIDENFGYNPLLGKPRQKMTVRILAFRQELDRLIAWYGR